MASEPREVWGDLATSAFVESNHLFRSLDEESLRDLVKMCVHQTFAPAEPVIEEGTAGDGFYLVREGRARVTVQRAGRAVDLGTLEKGAFFGEFRLLTGDPHGATVSAGSDLTVVRFPAPLIAALADRFPKMRRLLETVKAGRARDNAVRLGESLPRP